ncbi:MAG: hypothetical protein C7B45_09630 [Sulfobacillus acidophilus]|uniref:Uncharacterized protein n=1 Tax=Sulfobacillus acidophilus TaxID=53633 RepID=A0A2T2WHL7_9FIRM|nr:MAG: hypothetical protein C7B45_09630 [Sulfobacillus acidophilus]
MPEANLLAAFADLAAAQRCQNALRDEGFDVIEIDRLDRSDDDSLPHPPLVNWGRDGYQIGRLQDKWTTSAAWTDSPNGLIAGGAWLLTAVVPSEAADHVRHVIQQYGGSL